jgi:hypothetical protein
MYRLLGTTAWLCPLVAALAVSAQAQDGKWIKVDPATQRYSVAATDVSRGELLDDLEAVSHVVVRPRPADGPRISLNARGLSLEEIVARIVPADTHSVFRLATKDTPAAERKSGKKSGPALDVAPGARAKPAGETRLVTTGNLKQPAAQLQGIADRPATGPDMKPAAADLLRMAQIREPKKPADAPAPRETVRLTVRFERGAAPKVIRAQAIEGRAPMQRQVRGRLLYAVANAGGILDFGTFLDPLEVHSFNLDGTHSVDVAPVGDIGISIARTSFDSGSLVIVDLDNLSVPAQLDAGVVRNLVARGKTVATFDLKAVLRTLDTGAPL